MNDFRPPKPKRRWYQFSLRTLLVAGIGHGCLGSDSREGIGRTGSQ